MSAAGNRPLRICQTIFSSPRSPFHGGSQFAVHELATALSRLGHEVHALCTVSPRESLLPDHVRPYIKATVSHPRHGSIEGTRVYRVPSL